MDAAHVVAAAIATFVPKHILIWLVSTVRQSKTTDSERSIVACVRRYHSAFVYFPRHNRIVLARSLAHKTRGQCVFGVVVFFFLLLCFVLVLRGYFRYFLWHKNLFPQSVSRNRFIGHCARI